MRYLSLVILLSSCSSKQSNYYKIHYLESGYYTNCNKEQMEFIKSNPTEDLEILQYDEVLYRIKE